MTGVMINALQTLSKSQMAQQKGRTGRTDEGDHITMTSLEQYEHKSKKKGIKANRCDFKQRVGWI